MRRSELKTIVKECLLEILMEGVAHGHRNNQANTNENITHQPRRPAIDRNITNKDASTTRSSPAVKTQHRAQNVDRNIEVAKRIVPNDPVMSSIFADTASTTLREQAAADSGRSQPTNDTGVDPMSLFENAGNWAALAFSDSSAKRN